MFNKHLRCIYEYFNCIHFIHEIFLLNIMKINFPGSTLNNSQIKKLRGNFIHRI